MSIDWSEIIAAALVAAAKAAAEAAIEAMGAD